MKRFHRSLASLFSASIVPAAIFFAITAHPARLFAEAAPPPPACSEPAFSECADASAGASCSLDGGEGLCFARLCDDVDSGRTLAALMCRSRLSSCSASAAQIERCQGKAAGDTCDVGAACGKVSCPLPDGGSDSTLACLYTGAEAGADGGTPIFGPKGSGGVSGTGGSSGGGCSVGAGGFSGESTFLGLFVAAAAVLRLTRRRRQES